MARRVDRPAASSASNPASVEEVELLLTGRAPTGEALGRHAGMVVFVPYAIPGERVRVKLTQQKRNFARGALVSILDASPARQRPLCPHFGHCGGCDWQHLAYDSQLAYKTAIVREQLARIGRLPDALVQPCVPSPHPFAYRSHARLAVAPDGRAGYRAAGTHEIVGVTSCPILEPALQDELQQLNAASAEEGLLLPGDEVELRTWEESIHVAGFDYRAASGVFFQANTAVAEALIAAVMAAVAWRGDERVLDLYCGVGLFTVPLGHQAATVLGVEVNTLAAADARFNLAAAGIRGEILAMDVAAALGESAVQTAAWDLAVLDPPRTGVEPAALARLAGLRAPLILYVSCEPATLARDARLLVERGYALVEVRPFDMFPQTRHVECLAIFRL